MKIICLTTGYMDSHCYLLEEQGHAVVIDPGDAEIVLPALSEKRLQADFGILTHEHCDHILGCTELQEKLGIPFYASRACHQNMQDMKKNFSRYFDAFVGVQTKVPAENRKSMPHFTAKADRVFDGDLTLDWQGSRLELRETPGHSQGSICVLVNHLELFAGDIVFADEMTSLRFIGSSREELETVTLPWLKGLPPGLRVWPGHGPSFLLGERLQKPITDER